MNTTKTDISTAASTGDSMEIHTAGANGFTAPPFIDVIRLRFLVLERSFLDLRITSQVRRFHLALQALPISALGKVSDVIAQPSPGSYDCLKVRLLKEYESSMKTKIARLLERCELGDKKPSSLLREMRNLAGNLIAVQPIDEKKSPVRTLTQVTKTLQLVKSAKRNLGYLGAIGTSQKIMYPRKIQEIQKDPVVGGTPIGEESAAELRQVVFGSSVAPPRGEWLRTGFVFRDPDQEFAYGLKASRNSTRGLLSVVQAHMVKYFLFDRKKTEAVTPELLLKPNKNRQTEALWSALASIIWTVGEKKSCKVCLPRDSPALHQSSTYFADGVTETLHLFEFSALEDLRAFLKRYVYIFLQETGPGALLLLYSAILTRGLAKVKADMEDDKFYLVSCEEEGSNCVITLLLTGRATPYLHNGVVYVGDEDHYAMPQWGIMMRSDIGFLIYNDTIDSKNLEESKQPGSRLKTPSFPVWVINCSGHYGVLFNTNSELLRNYHAERRFDLHYFSVGGNHMLMSIDTRYHERQNENRDVGKGDENSSIASSPMEKLIHTKWQDAYINFNGMTPTFW